MRVVVFINYLFFFFSIILCNFSIGIAAPDGDPRFSALITRLGSTKKEFEKLKNNEPKNENKKFDQNGTEADAWITRIDALINALNSKDETKVDSISDVWKVESYSIKNNSIESIFKQNKLSTIPKRLESLDWEGLVSSSQKVESLEDKMEEFEKISIRELESNKILMYLAATGTTLGIVLLIAVGYYILLLRKRIRDLEKKLNSSTDSFRIPDHSEGELIEMKDKILTLEIQLNEFTSNQELMKNKIKQMNQTNAISAETEERESVIMYTASTDKGIFYTRDLSPILNDKEVQIYQLCYLEGEKKGEYYINEDSEIQRKAIEGLEFMVKPLCDIKGEYSFHHKRINTINKGKIQKETEGWRIISKAVVKFV